MSRVAALVLFILVVAGGVLVVPAARSASPDIVVSQVYAGGGNFTHDFVELFNRGSTAVDVSGWTIQYASAGGTTWQATALSGSIAPGRHYLVELASAAAVGAPLPTPDATGTTNLAVSGGKVAIVRDASPLTCGSAAGSCSAVVSVADLIGYGTAGDYEGGGAAPSIDNASAAIRAGDGCTDTDANPSDFATGTPTPRNTASPIVSCGVTPPPVGVSQSAGVDIDIQAVLSIALERPTVSFGNQTAGATPAPVSERVTVVSNDASGYAVTVRRTAFVPADLPLGIAGRRRRAGRSESGSPGARWRRSRLRRRPTCSSAQRPPGALSQAMSGTRASASSRRFPWFRRVGTPPPSPSR
jgi:hypothetical protein